MVCSYGKGEIFRNCFNYFITEEDAMEREIFDEATGGLGIYGRLRRKYLQDYHATIYTALVLDGSLVAHLADVDRRCRTQLDAMVEAMAKQEGTTEALKAADQLEWVRRMNNIRNRAEEVILQDIVYGA
jgi:hypothetical protein